MCLRLLVAVLGLSVCVAAPAAWAATDSAAKGEIGGPPTLDIPRFSEAEGNERTGPLLVIGKGKAYDGPIEIVAADSRAGLCTFVEYPAQHDWEGSFCGALVTLPPGVAIEVQAGGGVTYPPGDRYTSIEGPIAPGVASVRVYFHRHGRKKRFHTRATVAQVSGELLTKLDHPEPFGYFAAKVGGCVAIRAFRAEALDASGKILGSDRFSFGSWRECLRPETSLPP